MADTPWVERARVGTQHLGTGGRVAVTGVTLFLVGLYANWVARVLGLAGPAQSLAETGMIVGVVLSFLGGAIARARRPLVDARARVANGAVEVERAGAPPERVPVSDVASGVILPSGHRSRLELLKRNGNVLSIELEPANDDALETLLDAAGIDPSRRAFRLSAGGWRSPGLLAAGAAFALMLVIVPIAKALFAGVQVGQAGDLAIRASVLALVVGMAWMVARFAKGTELVIGSDGVTVIGSSRKRFIPFSEISTVGAEGGTLTATLSSGECVSLGRTPHDAHTQAVITQIERARSGGSGAAASLTRLEALDRGERTLSAWREALAKIVPSASAYRAASIDRADLYELLADADAPEGRRVGAALALAQAKDADPEVRDKVRAAASACANDRVRVALEHIADGDEDDAAIDEATAVSQHRRLLRE